VASTDELSPNHWALEDFKQRMTTKQWRAILLEERDHINFRGTARRLVAHNLGAGVVEISKSKEMANGSTKS
jgi:hypothetical protein